MKKPSPAELHLLQILHEHGPSTVREVHRLASPDGSAAYTTVLKQLQTLFAKGLVSRDDSARSHVYTALQDPALAQRGLLTEFVAKVFGGSTRDLILGALGGDQLTKAQKAEIARILDEEQT